jgi:1-phosphofructokinase family hexose kinase
MIYTLTLNPALDRELTVSEIKNNSVLRTLNLRLDFGGKGLNVSRALAALGAENTAVGFAGGVTGQRILDGLNRLKIHTDFVQILGETRTNINIVSQNAPNIIKVNEAGPIVTADEQSQLVDKVRSLASPGDWWVMSGSLPPGVPVTIYADLIKLVQQAGAHAILDTSGKPLHAGVDAGPFLVKPNAMEATELTGVKRILAQPRAAVAAIHERGPANVLISIGKTGAIFSDGSRLMLAHSPGIEEQNPIGAGDSAVAGLVWGLSQQFDWPEALRWGVACGAATAALAGTSVGSKVAVEELYERVTVEELG